MPGNQLAMSCPKIQSAPWIGQQAEYEHVHTSEQGIGKQYYVCTENATAPMPHSGIHT